MTVPAQLSSVRPQKNRHCKPQSLWQSCPSTTQGVGTRSERCSYREVDAAVAVGVNVVGVLWRYRTRGLIHLLGRLHRWKDACAKGHQRALGIWTQWRTERDVTRPGIYQACACFAHLVDIARHAKTEHRRSHQISCALGVSAR